MKKENPIKVRSAILQPLAASRFGGAGGCWVLPDADGCAEPKPAINAKFLSALTSLTIPSELVGVRLFLAGMLNR